MCGYGQSDPVFFIPGSFSPDPRIITYVVPEGTAIFIGLGGAECSKVEPPPFFGTNEQELAACATVVNDSIIDLGVSINGEDVADVMSYRTVSPMFTLTFPEDNLFGVAPGVANSVSDSYSIIIAPPPPGEYEIVVSMKFEGEEPFVGTMRIIVEAPQIIEPEANPAATPQT